MKLVRTVKLVKLKRFVGLSRDVLTVKEFNEVSGLFDFLRLLRSAR